MAELIWECLIVSMILLFGINIGLAMGLTRLPKKKILTIPVAYGAILFIMSTVANFYSNTSYDVFNSYIPEIMGFIGVIIILSGTYTITKWKKRKEEFDSLISVPKLSSSICCYVGIISIVILLSKSTDVFWGISVAMTLAMTLLMVIFHFFSKFLRNAERPYPVLLGNFMILNGFYFLIIALFVPGIKAISSVQMSPLSIGITSSLAFLMMAGLGVFLVGVYLQKEGITNLRDIYQRRPLLKSSKIKKI